MSFSTVNGESSVYSRHELDGEEKESPGRTSIQAASSPFNGSPSESQEIKSRRPRLAGDLYTCALDPYNMRSNDHAYSQDSSRDSDIGAEDYDEDANSHSSIQRYSSIPTSKDARLNYRIWKKLYTLLKKISNMCSRKRTIREKTTADMSSVILFESNIKIMPQQIHWIYTDACFRYGKYVGYGAYIHDYYGNPIVACSGIPRQQVSPLYHQLEAVKAGLLLARKKGIEKIQMFCNHSRTGQVMERFQHEGYMCQRHVEDNATCDAICETCVKDYFRSDPKAFDIYFPILRDIYNLAATFRGYATLLRVNCRSANSAADYLAKMGKNNEYEPAFFPQELKDIINEGAYGHNKVLRMSTLIGGWEAE